MLSRRARLAASLSIVCGLFGCSPAVDDVSTSGGQVPQGSPPIADAWLSKCGSCHERPQPKLRPRDYIEAAMKRHKRRVSLDDDEWAAMIDFMAK